MFVLPAPHGHYQEEFLHFEKCIKTDFFLLCCNLRNVLQVAIVSWFSDTVKDVHTGDNMFDYAGGAV